MSKGLDPDQDRWLFHTLMEVLKEYFPQKSEPIQQRPANHEIIPALVMLNIFMYNVLHSFTIFILFAAFQL